MKDVSIIIISYNTKTILQECLQSIYDSKIQSSYEVIVVDNDSKDGSSEMIIDTFKEVVVIQNSENVGFSKANNIGIKKAQGKYVLFLNSDTKVYKSSIDEIVAFLDTQKDAGAATCRVDLVNGEIDDASHRGFPTPWNSFTHFFGLSKLFPRSKLFSGYNLGWMNLDEIHEIDALAGAYMMVRKSAGDEVGWWDEDFFWYGDDLDFCYRLKKKGWKIYYVPTVSILHYKGVSGGIKEISQHISKADSQTKKLATKARFDAMQLFYKKHYINKYPFFINWIVSKGISFKKLITRI